MTRLPETFEQPPPLGSWGRLYTIVAVVAVLVITLLYWFSATWNVPLGKD